MLRSIIDVAFPLRCAGCGEGAWPFCPACRRGLILLIPPGCRRCGLPAEEDLARCHHCPPAPLDSARAPFLYEGAARQALFRLKFSGWRAVAEALARSMVAVNDFSADAVTWVPLSPRRRAERGYDQARSLAREVARTLGLPLRSLLMRVSDTPPQARRGGPERRRAMRGAFRSTGRTPPSAVLLVDDVLTTGATAAECGTVLVRSGASRIGLLTAARATNRAIPAHCYTRPDSRPSLWLPGPRAR